MSKTHTFFDKLSNLVSGKGTSADRGQYAGYNFVATDPTQVESSYRGSWLMRKIVDIPPLDMTRAWRTWQAERDHTTILERAERALAVREKFKRALVLARLWGGGAIVMGVRDDDPEQELSMDGIRKGDLKYLHCMSRNELLPGPRRNDPRDPYYGLPEYFYFQPQGGAQVKIHPSRVLPFVGQPVPEGSLMQQADWFWGDPIYQAIQSAIQNADLAQDAPAALLDEAKVDVISIPDLMAQMTSSEYEDRLLTRLGVAAQGKSIWRALILDGEEKWEQKQINWTGLPDMTTLYLQIVAGAADIPITRLLGQSPKGLQSNGGGEERDYHSMIEARQDELVVPNLDRLDEVLIRHALGSKPDDVWFKMNPLTRLSEKDASEIEKNRATTIQTYANTGLIAPDELSEIAKSAIVESGQWPGADAAFSASDEDGEGEDNPEQEDPDGEELMLSEELEMAQDLKPPLRIVDRALLEDGREKPLYVSRKILNGADIVAHFKRQGIEQTLPAADLHVTIAFSRQPVDWMKINADWSGDDNGRFTIPAGGPRQMDFLGEKKDALVLLFSNDHLGWRHSHILEMGASWDWPEYQPHITISYQAAGSGLDAIEPWTGPIVLGPEIFAELDDDWKAKIEED